MSISYPLRLLIPSEIIEVVKTLRDKHFRAFVVGGALRDVLLGKEGRDWDLATSARPLDIQRMFPKVIPTGVRHGTLSVCIGNQIIDVSQFHGDGIGDDLRHRDFTINAMAYDPFEEILLDPFGGVDDLKSRLVRAVDDPSSRLQEDPLRILRAIRIAAELAFHIHGETSRFMRQMAGEITSIAPERVREEMKRALLTSSPSRALAWMRGTGVLRYIVPELLVPVPISKPNSPRKPSIFRHTTRVLEQLPANSGLRWAGLLHDVGKTAAGARVQGPLARRKSATIGAQLAAVILNRLRFSKREIRRTTHLIKHHDIPNPAGWSDATLRRWLSHVGAQGVHDVLRLCRADRVALGCGAVMIEGIDHLRIRVDEIIRSQRRDLKPEPALNGRDVMALLQIPPGPEVGSTLAALQHRVNEKPEGNSRDDLSRWLLERYAPKVGLRTKRFGSRCRG